MLNLLQFTQNSYRKIFIAYDKLVENPEQECARLCQFLDKNCGINGNAEKRIQKMTAQITASGRHFQHPRSLAEVETSTKEQRALFNFLRVKTMYPDEAFDPDDFALYPGWLEYLQTIDMFLSTNNPQEN
jgi:hypothetical protein